MASGTASLASLLLLLLLSSAARAWQASCTSFSLPSGTSASLIKATYYAAGDWVNLTGGAISGGSISSKSLPAFCRLQLVIHTNPVTNASALTDVWLPDAWDGRLVGCGNGGWSGGIVYGDLSYVGISNGHAAMSTDGGHENPPGNEYEAMWAQNDPDAIIDYAYRAVHMSTVAAKAIIAKYYAKAASHSYWLGCSSGGREGLKSVQMYPNDYDGVVVGSPVNWITHHTSWLIHMYELLQPVNSSQWIPPALWPVIGAEVYKQCDGLDGVIDGVINDPRRCFFRPEAIACRPGQNPATCINLDQIAALRKIYADYYETNQTYIFGRYEPGGEALYYELFYPQSVQFGSDYYTYMVLNDSSWNLFTFNYADIQLADALDVGHLNAIDPNITAFASRGKLIHYVGWADQAVAPSNSLHYYESVAGFMQANSNLDIDDYYRLFPVPGMAHCGDGPGANSFGGAFQTSSNFPPYANDAQHDVMWAMIDWVEKGIAPDMFTAVKWVGDNPANGAAFTRPVCKFPQEVTWDGVGNTNLSSSFYCK